MMTSSRAICAMSQLRMLPASLARLHPHAGTPHLAVLVNGAMISVATIFLRLEALLELSMFFYAINALVQCAALLRLRATHPHRLRPQRTIPGPLLLLPASIAALMLLASPLTNWLSAAALFACTLLVYALIHVVRITRGHVPGAPPSARAAALADTLRVAERGPRGGAQDGDHDLYDGTGCYDGGGGGSRSSGPPGDAWFRSLLNSYRRVPAVAVASRRAC